MYALLIAEDPDEIAIFSVVLQRAGLAVTTARNLDQAMDNWTERPADVILIANAEASPQDQVLRVRTETLVPLILVLNSADNRVQSELLRLGADLVIDSSFDAKLLIAQVGVLVRRASTLPAFSLPSLSATDFTLDPTTRTIELAGKPPQRLTHLEFRLLYTLMINRNHVVSTETIVERVWGYTGQGDRDLVRGLISRLRVKVETDPRNPQYIQTMPGVGYLFSDEVH